MYMHLQICTKPWFSPCHQDKRDGLGERKTETEEREERRKEGEERERERKEGEKGKEGSDRGRIYRLPNI